MILPNEAVEAALTAFYGGVERGWWGDLERAEMTAAINAALPFLAPQPSQSDENLAALCEQMIGVGALMRPTIANALAAGRAEAALAGAVAERDRIADWAEKTFVNGPVNIAAAIRARRSTP